MTINAPASMIFAMFLATAERQGADWRKVGGTLQNDILKEYIAPKEWIYPPRLRLGLITDTIEFCSTEVPRFNPISISGYHIRSRFDPLQNSRLLCARNRVRAVRDRLWNGRRRFRPAAELLLHAHNDFFER